MQQLTARERSNLEEFSMGWLERRRHAPMQKQRVKEFPWDSVKRVTGISTETSPGRCELETSPRRHLGDIYGEITRQM